MIRLGFWPANPPAASPHVGSAPSSPQAIHAEAANPLAASPHVGCAPSSSTIHPEAGKPGSATVLDQYQSKMPIPEFMSYNGMYGEVTINEPLQNLVEFGSCDNYGGHFHVGTIQVSTIYKLASGVDGIISCGCGSYDGNS
ncbi:hypothetical protein Tco_0896519 [Tanacetum coccineum]